MKLLKIYNSFQALTKLYREPLNIKLSLKVKKLVKEVEEILQEVERTRIKLVEEFSGEEGKDVPEEKFEDFSNKFMEVLDEEVELERIFTLKVDDLDQEKVKLSAEDLDRLDWIIKE